MAVLYIGEHYEGRAAVLRGDPDLLVKAAAIMAAKRPNAKEINLDNVLRCRHSPKLYVFWEGTWPGYHSGWTITVEDECQEITPELLAEFENDQWDNMAHRFDFMRSTP